MSSQKSNIEAVLESFDDLWSPRILAHVNDWDVRLAKVKGEFVWHAHPDTDELFIVLDGELEINLREPGESERAVSLSQHDVFVVPQGVEHRPVSEMGATIMLLEPSGTVNVGDYEGELPAHISATDGTPAS